MQYDRPTAAAGLQQRLLRTMGVRGGFGIFDGGETKGLLRRSLLWYRGNDTPSLNRIEFLDDQIAAPSWSWMAHMGGKDTNGTDYPGGIDYFKLEFDGFDWGDIESPWSKSENGETNTLIADAREYNRSVASVDEISLVFDAPGTSERCNALCVVMGVQKGTMLQDDKRHYVVLVRPTADLNDDGSVLCDRIGAGFLPGKCITGDAVSVNIH